MVVAAAYYPDWASSNYSPSNLNYSLFDILFFAFATPSSSNGISWDSGSQTTLQSLVSSAKAAGTGTKICLSIGGWGGCQYYSQTMSTAANRTAFVNACVSVVKSSGLDGLDFDWEYPNASGAGQPCSPQDSANFLSFFTALRSALGSSKLITATATDLPWLGSNGNPLTDVSAYAAQLSYVNIMNYDVWGASSTPGPNAPLGNLCGNAEQPQYSAQAALTQWTAAKFPAAKLLLGLPLYGYVNQSSATHLSGSGSGTAKSVTTIGALAVHPQVQQATSDRTAANTSTSATTATPQVHAALATSGSTKAASATSTTVASVGQESSSMHAPVGKNTKPATQATSTPAQVAGALATTATGDLSSQWGQQIAFNDLINYGALKNSGSTYVGINGYTKAVDACSDTPFLYDVSRTTVITYDDPSSLTDKATFAKNNGMGGCFTWSLDQDHDGYALQTFIRTALGK